MELRQLNYFVRVAQTLNFSEAARSLFVTQSTLSQQIKSLEEELDTQLFERNSHSVTLTENGEKLLPLAQKTILDAKDCKEQIRDLQEVLSGELNIGVTYSFCPILNETIRNYLTAYPGIKLNIYSSDMEDLMGKLRNREIDFALAFKPIESYEEIESHTLFDDKLSVILRKDHPLANKESINLSDLSNQSIALPAKGLQARNVIEKYLNIDDLNLNVRVELNEVNILLDVVQSGKLMTVLSEATIYYRDQLKAIPLNIPQNQMEGCIHVLKKTYRKRSAGAFIKLLCESSEINSRISKWL